MSMVLTVTTKPAVRAPAAMPIPLLCTAIVVKAAMDDEAKAPKSATT